MITSRNVCKLRSCARRRNGAFKMNFKKRYGFYPSLALLITAISITVRCIACFTALDYESGYFTSSLGSVAGWIEAAGCLLLFSYLFLGRGGDFVASFSSPATYIPTGTLSMAMFFMALELFGKRRALGSSPAKYVALAAAVLGILAIAYFILTSLIEDRHDLTRATLGLFAVLFLSAYAAYLYFNTDLPINSPNKLTDQAAYLSAAVFFLYEIRISLGREKWRAYAGFGFISASLLAYASIPELILYVVNGEIIANSIYESVMTFALFIFVTARLAVAATAKNDGECEFVTVLKDAALAREAEIKAISPDIEEEVEEIEDLTEQVSFDIPVAEPSVELAEAEIEEAIEEEAPTEVAAEEPEVVEEKECAPEGDTVQINLADEANEAFAEERDGEDNSELTEEKEDSEQ